MRRAAFAIPLLLILLAVAFINCAIPGTNGCVLRSVDKSDYVAQNEAIFSTIRLPRYLREAEATTYSTGIPARHSCFQTRTGRRTTPS